MVQTHTYRSLLSWQGSTAIGYDEYSRTHRVAVPPADGELVLSSDPTFRGDARLLNPEQLLLASASSCQLLAFLGIAARARIDVLGYEDEAEALMPDDAKPVRITRVTLRPRIVVSPEADLGQVERLVARAHDGCFIANTLTAEVIVEPTIEHAMGSIR